MFIGNPPGNNDRILDFSTAVTGTLFFVPTADFLDDLPGSPPGRLRCRTADAPPRPSPALRRFPGHRQLEEEHVTMNNLHRELAPISDAAWAEHRGGGPPHVQAARGRPPGSGPGRARRPGPVLRRHRPPHRDRRARRRGHRPAARPAQPIVELRVPFTVQPPGHRRRGARREGLRLAAGQGRGQEDRLRRGPGRLRGIPGRRDQRASGRARPTRRWPCPPRPRTIRTSSARR